MRLLSDSALSNLENSREDYLGYSNYASILGQAINNTTGPFTVGVYGEWGTGKTSLMKLIKTEIEKNDAKVITVWFNAWKYESEANILVPLVECIIDATADEKHLGNSSIQAIKNTFRSVLYAMKLKYKFPLGELDFSGDQAIERYEKLMNDETQSDKIDSVFSDAFRQLNELSKNDVKFVVIIDDLDRCLPDKAVQLLEGLKLVFNQSNFVFVMGIAKAILESYIATVYKLNYGVQGYTGRNYLDKIIQLPFHIPNSGRKMVNFTEKLISELKDNRIAFTSELIEAINLGCKNNPRGIIRLLNNIIIDSYIKGTDEVSIEYFAISRMLQNSWYDVFSQLLTDEISRDELISWIKALDDDSDYTEEYDGSNSEIVNRISDDSFLNRLVFNPCFIKWLENSDERNHSVDFLSIRDGEEKISKFNIEIDIDGEIIGGNTVREFYGRVLDHVLGENERLEDYIDLPYKTNPSNKRYLISIDKEPQHTKGDDFKTPVLYREKYYFETNKNRNAAYTDMKKLVEDLKNSTKKVSPKIDGMARALQVTADAISNMV